jgi:hypothetical protein
MLKRMARPGKELPNKGSPRQRKTTIQINNRRVTTSEENNYRNNHRGGSWITSLITYKASKCKFDLALKLPLLHLPSLCPKDFNFTHEVGHLFLDINNIIFYTLPNLNIIYIK